MHTQLSINDSKVKWLVRYAFSYVQPITQFYKQTTVASAINPVTTENTNDSYLQTGSHASCYCESIPCAVSKMEWDTKEDKSKSMMHVFNALRYAQKAHLGTK